MGLSGEALLISASGVFRGQTLKLRIIQGPNVGRCLYSACFWQYVATRQFYCSFLINSCVQCSSVILLSWVQSCRWPPSSARLLNRTHLAARQLEDEREREREREREKERQGVCVCVCVRTP